MIFYPVYDYTGTRKPNRKMDLFFIDPAISDIQVVICRLNKQKSCKVLIVCWSADIALSPWTIST